MKYDMLLTWEVTYMLRKIGVNGQITIPKEFIKQLGLCPGDLIDIRVENNKIVMEPMTSSPKTQFTAFKS